MSYHDLNDGASTSSTSSSVSDAVERPHSPTSLFEDSLFTLFSHYQPAHGDPGDTCKYFHDNLPPRYLCAPLRKTSLRYKIAQNSGINTKLFAHHQWDAGLYLADLIAEQSTDSHDSSSEVAHGKKKANDFVDVRGKTVVELGAGTGLPGLVACVMGAGKTVITDYPDPHVIDNLERNLDLALIPRARKERQQNPHYNQARGKVEVIRLGWGNDEEEARVLAESFPSPNDDGESGYDVVLAADVLWVSSAHPLLIHSIRKMLKRGRNARCVLIAGFHTGRPAVRRFFVQLAQRAAANDASLEQGRQAGIVPDWEEMRFGGIWERNIDGSQRAWTGATIPHKPDYDAGSTSRTLSDDVNKEPEAEEEMGDISDRGSWVVVACLRWADLE
ncbi:related to NNT1 - putative nicotinamide N-methyltransferase [Ustilago sp. UG-2017b]|nr:related to NNT1 - putative nicotinamide N-methyltransferase [Ustilago sp. UG-2017b]